MDPNRFQQDQARGCSCHNSEPLRHGRAARCPLLLEPIWRQVPNAARDQLIVGVTALDPCDTRSRSRLSAGAHAPPLHALPCLTRLARACLRSLQRPPDMGVNAALLGDILVLGGKGKPAARAAPDVGGTSGSGCCGGTRSLHASCNRSAYELKAQSWYEYDTHLWHWSNTTNLCGFVPG